MNRQIFLDMDMVIVDTQCPITDLTPDELIEFQHGKLHRFNDLETWEGIDVELWWATQPWTPFGRQIVALCERWVGRQNVIICSKPASPPGCMEGKLRWIEREIPDYAGRYIFTQHKAWTASGRTLLIDDNEDNVREFREAGGAAILCPTLWNANSKFFDNVPQFINAMLDEYTA